VKRLRDVGEFGLIELISRWIGDDTSSRVVVGPGDDCAVLRPKAGSDLVVSTDSLVEGVHFRWQTQSARLIGRRALVANLSDLAAMGAEPLGCVAALCAPGDLELRLAKGLIQGVLDEARAHGCPLVGGNLASARETSVTITVFGSVARGRALRRHRVRAGDRIFVTGTLGASALAVARAGQTGKAIRSVPVPRLGAARALSRLSGVGGCIDVSDGLVADIAHLLEGSGLGASIDAGLVPRPRGFAEACRALGLDPDLLCLGGGEDYEIVFTLRAAAARKHSAAELTRRLGVPVSEVGQITRKPGIQGVPDRLLEGPSEALGWRHF
jgi:thiamine-monophosphate kinase